MMPAMVLALLWQSPMPDAAALLKEVQAHQEQMDRVRENYTFHRLLKTQELNGKGEVQKTSETEHEVFFVNGRQVARLVARDGKPLSADEDAKEQERVRKVVAEHLKQPPSYGRGGGVNLVATVLGVSEVSNPRRVQMNGRPTLVFDFHGRRKAEAKGMAENAAKKLAGTMWIDEKDRQVARLEVEFYDDFRVGGGLLGSVQKGTVRKVEQSPIGEGLWMQTAMEQHMNMRVVVKSVV
jgi:hypothetical protein